MVAGKHTFSHFKYNYSEPKSMFYWTFLGYLEDNVYFCSKKLIIIYFYESKRSR